METKKDITNNDLPQGWAKKQLEELGVCIKGVSYNPQKDLYQNYKKNTAILLRSNNIQNNALYLYDLQFVNIKKVHKKQLLHTNDIIICMANGSKNHIGKIASFSSTKKAQYTFGAFMGCFRVTAKQIVKELLPFFFQSTLYKNHIMLVLAGSSINNLKNRDILSFTFSLPQALAEQKAITQVLSDVDSLLESIDKLIRKKQQLKIATMQQLLTGKRRLQGFTGKWEKQRLGDIAEIKKGKQLTRKNVNSGEIPLVAGGLTPSCYINKKNRNPEVITISASGANAGHIAFYACAIFASDCSTIEKTKNYDVKFIYFTLKLNQKKIKNLQTGGAQPHVYPRQLKNIQIYIPFNLSEQTAIAEILSDMDNEIAALKKQKSKYQQLKKGMMQQLLTGKIRLQ